MRHKQEVPIDRRMTALVSGVGVAVEANVTAVAATVMHAPSAFLISNALCKTGPNYASHSSERRAPIRVRLCMRVCARICLYMYIHTSLHLARRF